MLNLSDIIAGYTTRGSKGSVEDEHQTQSVEWLHETYELSLSREQDKDVGKGEREEGCCVVGQRFVL